MRRSPGDALSAAATAAVNRMPPRLAEHLGHDSPVASLLRPAVNRILADHPVEVVCRSGFAAGLVFLIEPRREKYYWTGAYEAEVQSALAELLLEGHTYWDIGSHIGFFAVAAARRVGPSGRVHAFEPAEPNRQRLASNVERNGLANVVIHSSAVTSRPGAVELFSHPSTSMWTTVEERGEGRVALVEATTLDELVERLGTPDLIKIDVEGAELDVLRGGHTLLAERHPRIIIELSSHEQIPELRSLASGYQLTPVGSRHWLLV